MARPHRIRSLARSAALAVALVTPSLAIDAPGRAPDVGRSYRIPYRITETNHFLVRARIDGKGPFNFLVDTGAPALFIGAEAARKIGLKPDEDAYFTPIGRLDFEGGASLTGMKARIEDVFQMVGMNALGLPGASIDGILGYTALARFRIELDPTDDRMTWTRLDFDPKDPFVPRAALRGQPPAEMRAMNAIGPLAKVAAALVGKQPEEELRLRGFVGLELGEGGDAPRVVAVLADSPAQASGLRPGDRLTHVQGVKVATPDEARTALVGVRAGDDVALTVARDGATLPIHLNAAEGL